MKNSQVEAVLRFYKDIDLDIQIASEWLEQLESGYNPLGAVVYDGMPHGTNISDQTAQLGIKLAESNTGERVAILKKRIKDLKKVRTEILKEITTLTPVHKTIIVGFYIEGQKWERIGERINYSVRQSKNIRCVALEVLGGKMARNRSISRSKIIAEIIN